MINFESSKIIINTDMYRGFQLDLGKDDFKDISTLECESIEKEWCVFNESNKKKVKEAIDECFLSDGSIDGSKMKENWFPQIQADIFISHSHQDKALAYDLSKWMYLIFDLKVFIDSDIWGYYKDLKDKMLKIYYRDSTPEKYNELEDFVSAHVHMMLSVALNQMIENPECLFFLNTPNSLSINVPIVGTTSSPWIYSEIATSRLLRKRTPQRLDQNRSESTRSPRVYLRGPTNSVGPSIRHEMSIDHLMKIDSNILREWKDQWIECDRTCPCHPLDSLYFFSLSLRHE